MFKRITQILFLAIFSNSERAQTIFTLAGTGTGNYSGDGVLASTSNLFYPEGLFIDGFQNLLIADDGNHRIRSVNTNSIITTVVGNGTSGNSGNGGSALSAQLWGPYGVGVDKKGNIYVLDQANNNVRKVDVGTGIIAAFAGNSTGGFSGDNGPAIMAQLQAPRAIAFDSIGNAYITDQMNHRVRKVDTNGIITTYVGTGVSGYFGDGGQASAAQISNPCGISIDKLGNIFIVDNGNGRIRKIDVTGMISTYAGDGTNGFSGDGGLATLAQLYYPNSVATDAAGNIYFSDNNNHRIRKVTTSGIISTIAGNGVQGFLGDGGPAINARLNHPTGIAVDTAGNVYFSDEFNHRVRVMVPSNNIENFWKNNCIIYPVPASDFIRITSVTDDYSISLFDACGKEIRMGYSVKRYGEGTEIDITDLPNGIYCLKIASNFASVTKKIVVQH